MPLYEQHGIIPTVFLKCLGQGMINSPKDTPHKIFHGLIFKLSVKCHKLCQLCLLNNMTSKVMLGGHSSCTHTQLLTCQQTKENPCFVCLCIHVYIFFYHKPATEEIGFFHKGHFSAGHFSAQENLQV